jgi:hypothetical protein
MNHFEKALDVVDAAVFSGDSLMDADNRKMFREMMERWHRKTAEWESIALSAAAEEEACADDGE